MRIGTHVHIEFTDPVSKSPKVLDFDSIYKCALYHQWNCPHMKCVILGCLNKTKKPDDYGLPPDTTFILSQPDPHPKDEYWTCDLCQKRVLYSSKILHEHSKKHLTHVTSLTVTNVSV